MSYTIPIGSLQINSSGQIVTSVPYTSISLTAYQDFTASSAPALSAAGHGRFYFDSSSNSFLASQNGSAYTTFGGGSGSGTVNSGTAGNLPYYATTGAAVSDSGIIAANLVLTTGNITVGGVKTFSKAIVLPSTSFNGSGGTITPDATISSTVFVSVDAVTTINGPTSGYNGQKILFRLVQDGTGHTVTFNTGAGNFRFSVDIPSFTASVATLTDYVGVVYNSTANRWDILGVVKGS